MHFSLLKAAEEVHLPKRLRHEYGGGLKEFVGSEAACFDGSDDGTLFFTTQERQSLVLHLLHTLRAGPHDLNSLPGLKIVDGQAIIPKCLSAGIISQVWLKNCITNHLLIIISLNQLLMLLKMLLQKHRFWPLFYCDVNVPISIVSKCWFKWKT